MVLNRAKELVVDLSDADISQKAKDIAQYSKKLDKMNDKYERLMTLKSSRCRFLILLRMMI